MLVSRIYIDCWRTEVWGNPPPCWPWKKGWCFFFQCVSVDNVCWVLNSFMLALCLASPRWVVGRQRRTVRGIQKETWMMKLLEVGSVGVDLSYQCHTTKKGWVLKNVGDQPDSFRVGTRHVHWPSCKKWGCFAGDLDCHCVFEADWHSLMLRQVLIDICIINMFLLSEWCCAVMPFASWVTISAFLKKWPLVFNLYKSCFMKKKFMQFLYRRLSLKPTLVLGFIQIIQLIRCPVNSLQTHPNTSLMAAIRIKFRVGEFGTGAPQLDHFIQGRIVWKPRCLGQIWMAFEVDGKYTFYLGFMFFA